MTRYQKLLPIIDDLLADTDALLSGGYGGVARDDADMRDDTLSIQEGGVALRAALDDVVRGDDALISAMAHDLRGMLNVVIGWTEIIVQGLNGELTPEQMAVYRRMLDSGVFLLMQIDAIINYSRANIGKLALRVAEIQPDSLIAAQFRCYDNQSPIDIILDTADAPATMHADITRCRQAIYYVVRNAADYGAEAIRVRLREVDDALCVTISDDGAGIPPEHLPHVVEPFYQINPEQSAGVGLGLTLARTFAAMQGGQFRLESSPAGTVCTLHFPLRVEF